jgi:excinuclease ABC subunit C
MNSPQLSGAAYIEGQVKNLPDEPGVYRMLDAKSGVLYVGKARNLKKRVAAYTKPERLPLRLQRMIHLTVGLVVVVTRTEAEALLLESNLIKNLKPRYNILLRDDKSFPYIFIPSDHPWPMLLKYRGARSRPGDYFGPFASATAVNQSLAALQKAFKLRTCSDAMFASRTRPCLLYQIKRCSAPCVERISQADYQTEVETARLFLSGKSQEIKEGLSMRMAGASQAMHYEEAAFYRDQIRALSAIQARQDINLSETIEADAIAIHRGGEQSCIQVFFFRGGHNYGNRPYFPAHDAQVETGEILAAFLGQFYADKPPPPEILLSEEVPDTELLEEALTIRAGRKVRLTLPKRGDRHKLIEHAKLNAREALSRRLAENATQRRLLENLAELFGLENPPERIEIYDNSHIQGTNPLGAMVVAGPEGFRKSAYRKFNIKSPDLAPGDDFAMMKEVLGRRFKRALEEDPGRESGNWPELVLIDGGAGQLEAARQILGELGLNDLTLVGVAKGPDRNAGHERFFMTGREPFQLPQNDPVLFFLQRLRDEAHRFAIGAHRDRRSRAMIRSALDEISGIGASRKKALLAHFGSPSGVSEAALEELTAVPGISRAMAKKIHDHFHPGE